MRPASNDSPIIAAVNGQTITQRQFESILPEDYQDVLTAAERREHLDRWITTQLLYDEAQRLGLGSTADIEARLENYRKDLVSDLLVQKVLQDRAVVTEREVRAYFETIRYQYEKELRVSHILVDTPEKAEKVKSLLGSKSFGYLVRRYSIDKHAGGGGDLGYLSKGNMLPEFEDVVFSMKVGDVSDIVESEFGYHIVKVTDIRDAHFKLDYPDVAQEMEHILTMEKRGTVYDSLIAALWDRADIDVTEDFFGTDLPADIDSSWVGSAADPDN
ncbi:MAG: peptidylprolyl isomerase [Candidatus Latescibacterota bacterium]|nr:MAG: peptidylprolyl isomerase [Candidatus Latescibacterota bacterium]